jgi:hypothetical protein
MSQRSSPSLVFRESIPMGSGISFTLCEADEIAALLLLALDVYEGADAVAFAHFCAKVVFLVVFGTEDFRQGPTRLWDHFVSFVEDVEGEDEELRVYGDVCLVLSLLRATGLAQLFPGLDLEDLCYSFLKSGVGFDVDVVNYL